MELQHRENLVASLGTVWGFFTGRYLAVYAMKKEYAQFQDQIIQEAYKESAKVEGASEPSEGWDRIGFKLQRIKPRIVEEFPTVLRCSTFIMGVLTFEALLADSIHTVLMHRNDLISVDLSPSEVAGLESREEQIELKVNRLMSRLRGFDAKFKFLSERLLESRPNFPDPEPPEPTRLQQLYEIHATRNILVHNMGVVDVGYHRQGGFQCFKVGEDRPITDDYVDTSLNTLYNAALHISIALNDKFCGEQ